MSDYKEFELETELTRRIDESLPVSEYPTSSTSGVARRKPPVYDPSGEGKILGASGFVIGYKITASYNSEKCCCDLKGSKIVFMAVAAVLRTDQSYTGHNKTFFGISKKGQPVFRNPILTTMEHEKWHTNGAGFDLAAIEEELGPDTHLKKKGGYIKGWQAAASPTRNCLANLNRKSENVNDFPQSDEECATAAMKCLEDHLIGKDKLDTILDAGLWHAPGVKGEYKYTYGGL